MEILAETLDLQRCLMQPLMSPTVAGRLQEWFGEANHRRYEFVADAIDTTLGEDETGLLLINERHQVQFPGDIEVIYIARPPWTNSAAGSKTGASSSSEKWPNRHRSPTRTTFPSHRPDTRNETAPRREPRGCVY